MNATAAGETRFALITLWLSCALFAGVPTASGESIDCPRAIGEWSLAQPVLGHGLGEISENPPEDFGASCHYVRRAGEEVDISFRWMTGNPPMIAQICAMPTRSGSADEDARLASGSHAAYTEFPALESVDGERGFGDQARRILEEQVVPRAARCRAEKSRDPDVLPGAGAPRGEAATGMTGPMTARPPRAAVRRVDDARLLADLVTRLTGQLGRHYFQDVLPETARTVETGYAFLATETTSQLLRETVGAWQTPYGAELHLEREGQALTVLLWAGSADFSGRFVYAVSAQDGYPWQVSLSDPTLITIGHVLR